MNTKTAKKEFIDAIRDKKQVKVIYYSQEQKRFLVKVCAPVDYGMEAGLDTAEERLHFVELNERQEGQGSTLSLRADQVRGLDVLDDFFDPTELTADRSSVSGRTYS